MSEKEEFEKLKQLIYSGDEANIELALTVGGGLGNSIKEFYEDVKYLSDKWGGSFMDLRDHTIGQFIQHIKEKGFLAGGIATEGAKEPFSPKFARIAHLIKKLQFWYVSHAKLPDNIEVFSFVEEFRVGSGSLKELPEKLWQIPTLRSVGIRPAKQFQWTDNLLQAPNLEHLGSESLHVPTLPSTLTQVPKLNSLILRAYGSPSKDATLPPDIIWQCGGLKSLEITGGPYLYVNEEFENLPLLENIVLEGLSNWTEVPNSLLKLKHLKTLEISNCKKIKALPDWFVELPIRSLIMKRMKVKNAFAILSKMPKFDKLILSEYHLKQADKSEWQKLSKEVEIW